MPEGANSCFRRWPSTKSGNAKTAPHNQVTSTYVAKFGLQCQVITVTWTNNSLSLAVGEPSTQATCTVDWSPFFFWRKQGSRRLHVEGSFHVDVFWNIRSATWTSTPEPRENYFVTVVCNQQAVLLLGDMDEEAYRISRSKPPVTEAVLMSRKEHVLGDTYFVTRAQFGASGRSHEVGIECQTEGPTDPALFISVDKEPVMEIKRLVWKFRGNETIYVEGVPVEILWDVHDWLFNPTGLGHAMFVFKPKGLLKSVSCKEGKWRIPSDFCLMLYAWKSD